MPTTLAGWVGVMLASLTIFTIIVGGIIRMARQHISSSIDRKLSDRIEAAVTNGMVAVNVSLGAINTQLVTQDGELSRVLDRVSSVESKIDNGLCSRQERIEAKMDRLFEHLLWDGSERRIDET